MTINLISGLEYKNINDLSSFIKEKKIKMLCLTFIDDEWMLTYVFDQSHLYCGEATRANCIRGESLESVILELIDSTWDI